jgi:hypothetical protein
LKIELVFAVDARSTCLVQFERQEPTVPVHKLALLVHDERLKEAARADVCCESFDVAVVSARVAHYHGRVGLDWFYLGLLLLLHSYHLLFPDGSLPCTV